jgi:hypothetical protein
MHTHAEQIFISKHAHTCHAHAYTYTYYILSYICTYIHPFLRMHVIRSYVCKCIRTCACSAQPTRENQRNQKEALEEFPEAVSFLLEIFTPTHLHIHLHSYMHMLLHMHTHIHINLYMHTHIRMRLHMHAHIHKHIHLYMHIHIHLYIHMHLHINIQCTTRENQTRCKLFKKEWNFASVAGPDEKAPQVMPACILMCMHTPLYA